MNTNFKHTALRGALLGVVLGLTACVNSLELATPNGRNRSQDREQAIREAVAYFDNHRALLTRAAEAEPSEEAPFVVGDIVVDWESAVTVSNEEKRYTDFTMRKDNRFYLLLEQEGEQMEAVEIYSRFASVEDFGLDTMNQYVATYIPDVDYLQTYRNVAHEEGINCAEWYEFSGVVMYTMLSGHYVAAYRYDGGTLTERAFLYDREQTSEENIADFCAVMEGVTLGVAVEQEGTRATIPDIIWIDPNSNVMYVYKYIGSYSHLTEYDPLSPEDYEVVEPEWENREGAGGGGDGPAEEEEDEEDPTGEELLEDLFDTSELSDEQKKIVGEMLVEIIRDCMGEMLYKQLVCAEGEKICIDFDFERKEPSAYNKEDHCITLTNTYNDVLLHEMFHVFQHLQIKINNENSDKYTSYSQASANYEVEAQIARYVFLLRRRAYDATNRYEEYCSTVLGSKIQNAGDLIDAKGKPYLDDDTYFREYYCPSINRVLTIAEEQKMSNINFNRNLTIDENLSNIQMLSKSCN